MREEKLYIRDAMKEDNKKYIPELIFGIDIESFLTITFLLFMIYSWIFIFGTLFESSGIIFVDILVCYIGILGGPIFAMIPTSIVVTILKVVSDIGTKMLNKITK